EKLRRLDEEQADADRLAEEERQAEFERLQKEAEEELERHKAEMRRAFAAIPAAFSLVEPWKKPFGGVELPKNVQKEFAPLFPYRDYLQVQWIPLVTPKGWWYHTERVPSVFLDDPYTQWNLVAHWAEEETEPTQRTQRSLKLNLAVLKFGEEGLEVEWNPQTAGLESNIEIVNKLPFSYLRISFGPNAITESGPGRELEKEPRPLPIPKRFVSEDNVTEIALAEIDFTKSVWFKDVSLWLPMQNKPFALSNKETTITRPANPVEKFDGVFGKDRFRIGLENLDLQASLVLEVSVRPETVKNAGNTLTATGEASDALWKKTVLFTVESDSGKNPSLTIPITAEAFPDRIEFRDTSQETQSEAIRERTVLTKTIREKTETLNSTKIETFRGEPDPTTAFELFKRSLQREIDDVRRKESQANEQFLAIPVARKSVLTGGFSIHYSVYLQGREETEPMLILTTPPR
ncbi:MAG: hypothetical protein FWC43_13305, partial [Planctomycetaceae bacterium]|nr:hypothetical protein [Planctomycetaceae bacterium]